MAAYRTLTQQRRSEARDFLTRALPGAGTSIVWEIGCGHGHFLTAYAKAHPEVHCVGIDISSDRIERALRKRERVRLPNLHFFQAEAKLFLEEMPLGLSLSTIFILFPDPWPKLRHRKHRILQPDFLLNAAKRTAPNGRLYFRTDDLTYFRDAMQIIEAHPSWQPVAELWPFEFETVFQQRAATHYSVVAATRK